MKTLRTIGGAALAFFLLVAVAAGLLTPRGQAGLQALRAFGTNLFAWFGEQLDRLGWSGSVAGNAGRAMLVGAVIFVALMLGVPAARSSRGGVLASVLASALVAVVAYSPAIVGG